MRRGYHGNLTLIFDRAQLDVIRRHGIPAYKRHWRQIDAVLLRVQREVRDGQRE